MVHYSLSKLRLDFQLGKSSWAQLHNVNNCHRDTSLLTTRSHLTQYNSGENSRYSPGNITEVPRLQSTVWLACVHEVTDSRCDKEFGWRWLSEAALWQWDNKKWGRKPLSLAAHVWVRAVDPAKPQWLTAQLAVRIISCVSLVCRSFSKSKALPLECRVKICMKWKTKQRNTSAYEKSTYKTHDVMRRISGIQCKMNVIWRCVFFPVVEQHWNLSCREVMDGLTEYKLYNSGVNAIHSLDFNAFIFPRSNYSNWCLALLSVCFTLTESAR